MHSYKVSLLFTILAISAACTENRYAEPLSPEDSIETFDLHEDFVIEVFAAEPHVWDPVELVFDEKGRAFVVEMPDYPYKPEPGQGRGRIRLLHDNDGDGIVDESVIFADGLPDATSLQPWKGGLIVTSAPHIFYLKDTNGDNKADVKEVLFEGFFENNSEAQITNLRFGIDNWIYAANNGQAGEVTYTKKPEAGTLDMRGADFRFRLDTDQFELESGTAQFGHTLDDWNNKFFTQNTLHIQQAVIPRRYLERNPHQSTLNVNANISDHDFDMFQLTPPPYWRAERTRRRNIQYQEQNLDRVEHADKHFTGASGGTVYNGDAFPEAFYGNVFTGDVAGNLIHRDVLVKDSEKPVFIAKRAPEEQDREFLASTDPWFRPTNFTVGPDGYLYVVDYYRQHIETPVSIPDDLKEDMDFYAGENHGRIYRIRPKNETNLRSLRVDLSTKTASGLVEFLAHSNGWFRLNAQRLLLEKPDMSITSAVEKMATDHADPRARLHAMYVLDGMDQLTVSVIKKALGDTHGEVKRHAIRLAERHTDLKMELLSLTSDSNPIIAMQAILSLGQYSDEATITALGEQLNLRGEDKWFRTAILSSAVGDDVRLLSVLNEEVNFFANEGTWQKELISEFAHIIGAKGDKAEIEKFVALLAQPDLPNTKSWQKISLNGLAKGLKRHSDENPELKVLLESIASSTEEADKNLDKLVSLL
ncbi:MAG TPA: PVC-type heme-binding CxxCH protein [Lunatimonas sp.]|nr:PVC-type heme-binding CxxCH protein [Lunatimonas sp.]